jgi:hypothetical protein
MAEVGALFCSSCGKGVHGKFCAHCGTAVAGASGEPADGWSGAARDLVRPETPNSVYAVMLRMARAPVRTILALAGDAAYAGQWKFLLAALGLNFSLINVVIPRLSARLGGVSVPGTKWDGAVFQALSVLAILIMAPAMLYACRWLGSKRPTPRSFLKLAVLSFGYWHLLFAAIQIVSIPIYIALGVAAFLLAGDAASAQGVRSEPIFIGLLGWVTAFWLVAAVMRPFCDLSRGRANAIAIGYLLMSQLAVFPAIGWVANRLHLTDWLKQLGG